MINGCVGLGNKIFIEIINDQLSMHNSDEKLHPILSGNEGRMAFLTEEKCKYIRTHFDKKEGPMHLDIWWNSKSNMKTKVNHLV